MIHWNKTKTDCGIVAAYNASAWCNKKISYEEVESTARSCGYSSVGIYGFQFINLIKKLGLPDKRVTLKSVTNVEKQLHKGKFFIFYYTPSAVVNASGHIITAFVDHTGNIRIVNPDPLRTTWRSFVNDLTQNGVKNFAAWEIPQR